jgi:ABC-type enterochelin transport system ATPase subunit
MVDMGNGIKQVEYSIVNQQLNKLDVDISKQILDYMEKVDEADVQNPLDTYEEVVFSVINAIAIKTQTVVSLDTGTISYTKINTGA